MICKRESLGIRGKVEIFRQTNSGWEKAYEKDNLVVNGGLELIVDHLKDISKPVLTHIAVGTGATPVQPTDTILQTELLRKPIDDIDTIVNVLTAETLFENYEAVGLWKETGMFTQASGGIMFNRVNIDFNKTTADVVKVKFTVTTSAT